jgi:septal ring-binding cell division protein DamX
MPIFDENKLKDEELFSGFPENDNDTFSLNKQVQASQPQQEVNKKETIPETEEKKTRSEPKVIKPAIHKVKQDKTIKKSHPLLTGFLIAAIIIALFAVGYYWLTTVNSPTFFLKHSSINYTQDEEQVSTPVTIEKIEETTNIDTIITIQEIETVKSKTKSITVQKPETQKIETEEIIVKETDTVGTKPVPIKVEKVPEKIKVKSKKEITASKPVSVAKKEIISKTKKLSIPLASSTGFFTIQAYASASYDEATMWQKKLNRRNLNASIVPVRKKNKIIYTVRFGRFSMEAEAKLMAMKLGLSRSHIDRIK